MKFRPVGQVDMRAIGMKLCTVLLLAVAAAPQFVSVAHAQPAYPAKPVRVIVPMPPGAGQDLMARKIGDELAPRLGQPWLIDNRPGGANLIAAEACVKAAPDGYSLCLLSTTVSSFNPHLFDKLPYDPERDFKPIANLYAQIEGLIASRAFPANALKDIPAAMAAKPAGFNFGTLGAGTGPDIQRQWLAEGWKGNFVGIPYKGGNLVITALVAGEIDIGWIGTYNAIGQIKAGKVKILAIGGSKRSALLPEVPTIEEAGLGQQPLRAWVGLGGPAGMPDAVVRRVNTELVRLFRDPRFVDYIDSQFIESLVGTPEEFAAFMRADREKIGQVIRRYNVPKQ
jgi:tripartite-type tricarboxylate transporter receptor subunit TctC